MTIHHQTLVDHAISRGPFDGPAEAERAVRGVLRALGQQLAPDERGWLVAELDEELGRELATRAFDAEVTQPIPESTREQLFQASAEQEGVRVGRAAEHARVVLLALAELLPPELLVRLRKHLPEFGELFEPPPQSSPPEHAHVLREPPRADATLAGGRPGSRNPLGTARPGSEHPLSSARPERAHRHSVARSNQPHADTKLSSAKGLSQERAGTTLADARPGKNPGTDDV